MLLWGFIKMFEDIITDILGGSRSDDEFNNLLLESGDNFLLENGFYLLLE